VITWRVPYGYRRLPRGSAGPARLEIYEPEAEVVRSRSELILSVVSFSPVRRNPPNAAARLRAGIMNSPTRSEHL